MPERCENKKSEKKYKLTAKLLVFLLIFSAFLYYFYVSKPFVKTIIEEMTRAELVDVGNTANIKIEKLFYYEDLFSFTLDNEGKVSYIKSNTKLINQVNMLASTEIQRLLNGTQNKKVELPLGAFTGSAFLSGKGRKIELNVISIGSVDTRMRSELTAAGINQVLHRLIIDIFIKSEIVSPWQCDEINVWYEVTIAENLFSGNVPNTYIESISDSFYDLIPEYN